MVAIVHFFDDLRTQVPTLRHAKHKLPTKPSLLRHQVRQATLLYLPLGMQTHLVALNCAIGTAKSGLNMSLAQANNSLIRQLLK
jgi:hypothetical protein